MQPKARCLWFNSSYHAVRESRCRSQHRANFAPIESQPCFYRQRFTISIAHHINLTTGFSSPFGNKFPSGMVYVPSVGDECEGFSAQVICIGRRTFAHRTMNGHNVSSDGEKPSDAKRARYRPWRYTNRHWWTLSETTRMTTVLRCTGTSDFGVRKYQSNHLKDKAKRMFDERVGWIINISQLFWMKFGSLVMPSTIFFTAQILKVLITEMVSFSWIVKSFTQPLRSMKMIRTIRQNGHFSLVRWKISQHNFCETVLLGHLFGFLP